jgi:branched-chain amino acid transport system substrate-binding protein
MRMGRYFVAIALILAVFLSGCVEEGEDKEAAITEGDIKIGVMQSLTGDLGSYGGPMSDAIKLAAKEINDNGGLLGRKLVLLIEDDQTNREFRKTYQSKCLYTINTII